jgi:PAS domain S-box-containing protein
MKFPVENKILAGFVVTAVMLGGVGWLSFRATTDFITAQDWVAHSQDVISQLEVLLVMATETDTDQRGYLLTGDPKFLTAQKSVESRIPSQLNHLEAMTADNSTQQDALKQLEPPIQKATSLMDDRIAAYQKTGLEGALARVPMAQTESAMNDVQTLTAQIRSTEEKLLAQRRERARASANRTGRTVVTFSLSALGIGLIAMLLSRRDLKLRALAEMRLQQNEERFRLMIASVRDYAILLLDPQGRIASWNLGAQRINGYDAQEIIGQPFSKFYPPEAIERGLPQQLLAEAIDKGHFEDTGWHVRKDGSHFWANVTATAVRDVEGVLLGFVKVTRDLTERKRAEEIQQERDRYFDLSREMICVLGFDGFFKSLNPAWKWTLGFSTAELQARPFIEFVHPDDRKATETEAQKLIAGGETIYFENRYLCKDGSWRWFAWSARAAIPQKIIYGTGRDITDRKQAQEKIEQLNTDLQRHAGRLEETNKELEAFSYSVSHDLRAPLRHIDGFVKMFTNSSGDKLDARGRRYLDIIADSAQKMGVLIDDLLVFSRMSRAELRHSKVSTDSLVHEAVDGLQTETNGRQIHWNIGTLPEVEADPAMLQQVWVNLISNAVKYTRPRNPAEIEIGSEESGNGEYTFFVHDNGVGFDMQYGHKLFGVFQRLHRADEFEGTGIGLANVSRIIHKHGGRVWAEAKPNAGATFYFSLPKKPTEKKA